MKKFCSILLCLILLISCGGCSNPKSGLPSDHLKIIQEYIDNLDNSETARICGDVLVHKVKSKNTIITSIMVDSKNNQGVYTNPQEYLFSDDSGEFINIEDDMGFDGQLRLLYQVSQAYQAAQNNTFEETKCDVSKDFVLQLKSVVENGMIKDSEFEIVSGKDVAHDLHIDYVDNNESLDYHYLGKYLKKTFNS